jgi:hypothetical protein
MAVAPKNPGVEADVIRGHADTPLLLSVKFVEIPGLF